MTDASVSRRAAFFVFVIFLLGFTLYATTLGPDANWDLRNYHLYNPFALTHGKFGYDLVPAQIQTFLAPQLDLLSFGVRHVLNGHPALFNAVMSLPTAGLAFLAFLITARLLPLTLHGRLPLAALIATIGCTGAAGLPTLATTSSEAIPGLFVLGGLLLLLRAIGASRPLRLIGLAGLALGIGAGFKLTSLSYCVGGCAALLVLPLGSGVAKLKAMALFAVAGIAGTALIAGPWCLLLWTRFHSPLFPFLNQIFHAPAYLPLAMSDDRFKPQGLLQTLFYPFFWAVSQTPRVSELPMRDPRFAAAYVMLAMVATIWLAKRGGIPAQSKVFAVFFVVSYIAWEKQFSIIRYLAPLEAISAAAVVAAWRTIDSAGRRPWLVWFGTACLGFLCGTTVYPDWGRAPADSPRAITVGAPQLPPNALVILLDGAPMAYVAAFEPPSVRFVGANNNLVQPGQDSGLNHQVEVAIRDAGGPLWGLEYPPAQGMDDATLSYYHLHRSGACLPVLSNIDGNSLRLCPLARGN
ncbi:hypothetical protein [Acidisoma sp. 7E03]